MAVPVRAAALTAVVVLGLLPAPALAGNPHDGISVRVPKGDSVQIGTKFADLMRGTDERDFMVGEGGRDRLFGYGGNDVLVGGQGGDVLWAYNGKDILYGNGGNDILNARQRDGKVDYLNGGDGRDTCYARRNDIVVRCEVVHRLG